MAPRAVVVGSGPNGLAAAVVLARAGLEVVVHEEAERLGGGLRTEELTLPGFRHDVCSAIHPLARASPFLRELELDVEWVESPACLAHPLDDEEAVLLRRDLDEAAAGLGADADAYRRLVGPLDRRAIERVLLAPRPPFAGAAVELVRALGPTGTARALGDLLGAATAVAVRRLRTVRGRALLAGCAAHSGLPLERRPSAGVGLTLLALGHAVGWPFPRGGAQALADALASRLREAGGEVRLGSRVDELPCADLVLCDVAPRELLRLAGSRLPARYARALARFRHGPGAFKLDWALAAPIPWRDARCRLAATVHLGGSLEAIAAAERAPWQGCAPERPFVILAQPTLWDETRAPAGRHVAWAYGHVPPGFRGDVAEAIEAEVERHAPGFQRLVLGRSALGPQALEAHDRNLVGGEVTGGVMDLRQLVARPALRLVPYRTPLRGVYVCSASTPPGGGVHGVPGCAAARVALRELARRGRRA